MQTHSQKVLVGSGFVIFSGGRNGSSKIKCFRDEFQFEIVTLPKGNAGNAILNALKRNKLINSVIFIIRYFGGTKLGISGLIYAYGTAAKEVIVNAKIKLWLEKKNNRDILSI